MKTQRNIAALVALTFILLFFFEKCKKDPEPCPEIVASQTDIDTLKGDSPGSHVPIPTAQSTQDIISTDRLNYTPLPESTDERIDPASPNIFPAPLSGTKKDFTQLESKRNFYDEILPFVSGKDTLGKARIKDTVENNMITGRSYSFEIYKTTITNNLVTKRRNKYYWGFEAIGNPDFPVRYLGLNLAVKLRKKEQIIIIGAGMMNEKPYYSAKFLFPFK